MQKQSSDSDQQQGYNGWTNYETWAVALWFGNDEGTQNYWEDEAKSALENKNGNKEDATYELTSQMKEETLDGVQDALAEGYESSLYSDLLNASLKEVDYYEIAKNYIDEAAEAKE